MPPALKGDYNKYPAAQGFALRPPRIAPGQALRYVKGSALGPVAPRSPGLKCAPELSLSLGEALGSDHPAFLHPPKYHSNAIDFRASIWSPSDLQHRSLYCFTFASTGCHNHCRASAQLNVSKMRSKTWRAPTQGSFPASKSGLSMYHGNGRPPVFPVSRVSLVRSFVVSPLEIGPPQ